MNKSLKCLLTGRRIILRPMICTATRNSGHSLKQDCGIILIYLKGVSDGEPNENVEPSPPSFRSEVVLEALRGESSQVSEVCPKPHNLSDEQLSKWKRQLLENVSTLFEPADKQSDASAERIAQLEQIVGRLTLAPDIEKKVSLTYLS